MVADETENPRKTKPRAFKTIIYRLVSLFYVMGALSADIILKHDDPTLASAIATGASSANVSPYKISMNNI
ncbi:unnamed protein product [Ambrosiozyma monospora]|uniref:Unnamed protein product n=1 Tax=Ambrosiozyma monospora TaxID=43982 RepID=A0A9W6Z4G0_AMBMO|nr:unnamed protein product [Ambrosiozyma monospora]